MMMSISMMRMKMNNTIFEEDDPVKRVKEGDDIANDDDDELLMIALRSSSERFGLVLLVDGHAVKVKIRSGSSRW